MDTNIGVKGHGVKLFLTDLPWGDTKKAGYDTSPDYANLAEFFSTFMDSVQSLSSEHIDPDLGRKRKRGGEKQESIVVAMGDTPALSSLKDALAKKSITVCSNCDV